MIVLHLFVPGRKTVRQGATWRMLEQLRRHGRYVVIDWPTVDELDNYRALAWCWNRGQSVLVLEQDVEPTLEQLAGLESCNRADVCVQATSCGAGRDLGYDFRIRQPDGSLRWGRAGEEWADVFPLSCTLLRPRAMARLGGPPYVPWQELDTVLAHQLAVRVHVHWPAAAHHHG